MALNVNFHDVGSNHMCANCIIFNFFLFLMICLSVIREYKFLDL